MRRIPPEIVAALISLGRNGTPGIPECLADQQVAWHALVRGKEHWQKVVDTLSEEELRCLIQGLVLYSRARERGVGGSASPVIVLYHNYITRFPDQEPTLTEWVVENRVNPCEPFGNVRDGGARSYAEFLENVRRNEIEDQARQLLREQEAARMRTAKATRKLASTVRRGDLKAVASLLAIGADPTRAIEGGGSLLALAEENGRESVAAYLRSQGIR